MGPLDWGSFNIGAQTIDVFSLLLGMTIGGHVVGIAMAVLDGFKVRRLNRLAARQRSMRRYLG